MKMSMDSHCIQASALKSISLPNVREECQAKCHFDKNVKMMFCVAI